MSKGIELVTLYRGRDSATYLLSEFLQKGTEASPIKISQYPGDSKPFHKMEMKDTDAISIYEEKPIKHIDETGAWDLKALKKILKDES